MIDLFTIDDFLDAGTRERILAEMQALSGGPATVYGRKAGGAVEALVRKATRTEVSLETSEYIKGQLWQRKDQIEGYFGESVSECEEPQFLRYHEGDYFIPHQDGNTPLILDESRLRKISIVIFLSAQSSEPTSGAYVGGSLLLHGSYPNYDQQVAVANHPGTLVAFRAQTTHEVTPVTFGERYTIVSWYR